MERTVKEGAEAARDAGREIADLVYEKQLAYGDSSGIQHKIWKALMAQYLAPANVEWGGPFGEPDHPEHNVRYSPNGQYVIPIELMDHIPRLTRVFDRICRIVSNPAQDRMGEDPWRDLAGDALCGIVMPRTKPEWKRAPDPIDAGVGLKVGAKVVVSNPNGGHVNGIVTNVRVEHYGDDPNEPISCPHSLYGSVLPSLRCTKGQNHTGPCETSAGEQFGNPLDPSQIRFWNEEPIPTTKSANGRTITIARNPLREPNPEDVARAEEYAQRARDRAEADEKLAQRAREREARAQSEGL